MAVARVMRRALVVAAAIVAVIGPADAGHFFQSVVSGVSRTLYAQQEEPSSPRSRAPLTLLQINDVYSTVPIDGAGGLARVATIKRQLAAAGRTPFLVLAGDFLSPSVASSVFKGEQMIAAMNAMGLDLATLGNHEFDFGDDLLVQRMHEAKWQWVAANVIDTRTGKPIGGAAPYVIRKFGPLNVAFLGLCLTSAEISRDKLTHTRLVDPLVSAARYIPEIRRRGANVIVAVTHLTFAEDRLLVQRFPDIDVIIGGHEHYPITATERRTLVSKAGADAHWVARIDINRRPTGIVERFYELIPVTSAYPDEPETAKVVADFESRLGAELDTVIGTTTEPLDAVGLHLRSGETNLGDLVADAVRAHAQTDVALMNGGSIRGDRVYPAGPLTRRTIVAIHPFGNVICKLAIPGRILVDALTSGVSALPDAAGQFPQVSGLTMTVDANAPKGQRVKDVKVNGAPIEPAKTYTIAIPDYVLKGGDNYAVFAGQKVLVGPEAGDLLVTALEKYIATQKTVSPKIDGRITVIR